MIAKRINARCKCAGSKAGYFGERIMSTEGGQNTGISRRRALTRRKWLLTSFSVLKAWVDFSIRSVISKQKPWDEAQEVGGMAQYGM
jgi:hypothetical protein